MGNDQQNQGMLDRAAGTIKEGVGKLTGDEQMEYEGKLEQGEGQLKQGVGNVREDIGRATDDDR